LAGGFKEPFATQLAYYSLDVTVAAGRLVSRAGRRPAPGARRQPDLPCRDGTPCE